MPADAGGKPTPWEVKDPLQMPQLAPDRALRVLVADDDAEALRVISSMIGAFGHTVVAEASTGRDAVTRAKTLLPDVAVLDVHMPELDGLAAAEELSAASPDTAIVLLTGDLEASLGTHGAGASRAVAFLPKPARAGMLESTLRLAVARSRELRAAKDDAHDARRKLEERKMIERAKGILMRRTGSSEAEAYRILQRSSQDRATPMIELAKAVISSEEKSHH